MMTKKPIQRRQLVDDVIEHLRNAIQNGDYPIDTRLPPEAQLMADLGVGRSTLREAVRVLAHNGVLDVRQGDGTYVRANPTVVEPLAQRLQRAALREIQEVRRALELETARLAAQRRRPADLTAIAEALHQRRDAVARRDAAAALDADIAFHNAIAAATGNAVLSELYHAFSARLRPALMELWQTPGGSPAAAALHDRLFQAIADRHPDDAVATITTLLDQHDLL